MMAALMRSSFVKTYKNSTENANTKHCVAEMILLLS